MAVERATSPRETAQGAVEAVGEMGPARGLFQAGGIDLAASLAYFTILSILPLVALAIIAAGIVGNPEGVGEELAKILVYYFPASNDLIGEAVRNLLNDSLGIGILALIGIVIGSNGLFMAAHRAVNRIFWN